MVLSVVFVYSNNPCVGKKNIGYVLGCYLKILNGIVHPKLKICHHSFFTSPSSLYKKTNLLWSMNFCGYFEKLYLPIQWKSVLSKNNIVYPVNFHFMDKKHKNYKKKKVLEQHKGLVNDARILILVWTIPITFWCELLRYNPPPKNVISSTFTVDNQTFPHPIDVHYMKKIQSKSMGTKTVYQHSSNIFICVQRKSYRHTE